MIVNSTISYAVNGKQYVMVYTEAVGPDRGLNARRAVFKETLPSDLVLRENGPLLLELVP